MREFLEFMSNLILERIGNPQNYEYSLNTIQDLNS